MSVIHLPPSHGLPMLRIVPPLSVGRNSMVVHCSHPGCQWAAVADDITEAVWKLEAHLDVRHSAQES